MSTMVEARLQELADELGIAVWNDGHRTQGTVRRMARAARESFGDRLPPRYATDTWHIPFRPRLRSALTPGVRILDVGAGARPTVAPEDRPVGTTYVGLDVDGAELLKAPAGSYDDVVVGDVCTLHDELVGQFDLVLSWLTMEHVKPVPVALRNLGSYQREGGRFLGYLAGGYGLHAVLNRVVPHPIAKVLMQRTTGREPDTVFRAHYDHCTHSKLSAIAGDVWATSEVLPLFTGGWYFRFSPALRAPYLAYEEWAYARGHADLASYYLLDATR